MLEDKQPDVEVINDAENEEIQDAPSQVVVDLEKPSEKQPEQPKQSSQSSDEIRKLNNSIAYQTRRLEQAMRELQQVKTEITSRPKIAVQSEVNDPDIDPEADQIAMTNWQKGVKRVVAKDIESKVEAKVNQILSQRDALMMHQQKRIGLENELEKSKQRVLSKYPSVEDESTEESAIYRQVMNEDSTILSNIHGPEIAMYRMEERMRQMGKTPPTVKPIVDREVSRLTRAGASSVIGRQASPDGKITLTKDQKEFCDHHKLPYEQYAKNLKAQEANGGVEA